MRPSGSPVPIDAGTYVIWEASTAPGGSGARRAQAANTKTNWGFAALAR